ncbi:(2Fe-2S) ferredoxin domain-containing protein [Algoriphagus boseongensis]|uniref:(2Fe-2S) ferredoxin domain-containing protein n=1 Tax=Algoriphagus boseongensis TaxID=1442587 RepID=UPI00105D70A8|nr:(2Fe-2S) ferredoxin domain-containing protein [Algoriphagus boseongensis]
MRHPRKLIFVCTGSDCKKSGGKALKKQLKAELKEGQLKGNCKLISTKCMDMCKSAPVVIVEDHFLKKTNFSKVLQQLKKS